MKTKTLKLVYSAFCLAIAIILPLLTGQIPQIGNALCPMHIPVLLCGFICGWPYGLCVGLIAPCMRSLLFGVPPLFPLSASMAFELAAYGFLSGLCYKLFPKKNIYVFVSLFIAMILGRVVFGCAMYIFCGIANQSFTLAAFFTDSFANAVPGIIAQVILIPFIVNELRSADIILNK